MRTGVAIELQEVPPGPDIPSHAMIEKAAMARRDDKEIAGRDVKPAMAGIPPGAGQRMPEKASPGLPPVDRFQMPAKSATMDETNAEHRGRLRPGPKKESAERASTTQRRVPQSRHSDAVLTGLADGGGPGSAEDAERAAQGLARHSLSPSGASVLPGKWETGQIVIEFDPRIAAMILEALGLASGEEAGGPLWLAIGRKSPLTSCPGPDASIDLEFPGRSPHGRGTTHRTPDRVAARPDPAQWRDDELLTLPEAASLFWPDGPLTTTSLRTAARDGTLEIRVVAGRHMTTPDALRRLGRREPGAPTTSEALASMAARQGGRR